jgi:hypothetical protein
MASNGGQPAAASAAEGRFFSSFFFLCKRSKSRFPFF